MREISFKEYKVQTALGSLTRFRVTVQKIEGGETITLIRIPIEAANWVDALHKAWKKKRK